MQEERFYDIMIVDDDIKIPLLLKGILTEYGYKVITFASPKEALQKIADEKLKVKLVITDVEMPDMNGLEFIEKIRELFRIEKYIIISGSVPQYLKLPIKGGEFLCKPFKIENLLRIIEKKLSSD